MRFIDFIYGSTNSLLRDDRFGIDVEFFNRFLKYRNLIRYELAFVKLGDIRRDWDGKKYNLNDVTPYKYLNGDIEAYGEYCQFHQKNFRINMSKKRFDVLISSVRNSGYDIKRGIIILGYDDVLIDGQHRACCLFHEYGAEYKVCVLRLEYKYKKCFWWKLLRIIDYFKKMGNR